MSMKEWAQPSVHPEVRAYVASLLSALGGPDPFNDGRYKLGDEPKLCLLDIRKWLKTWDENTNRQDVARALAEADFVKKDALEIISTWHEGIEPASLWQDLALRCLELVTMLTWPLKVRGEQMTIHNHKQLPYLTLAQVSYKKEILQHDSDRILKTAIRLALPAMAVPRRERSAREEGIINIVLCFLLNVARIAAPQNLPADVDESDISRSALIEAFEKQDVFSLLLTVASSLGNGHTAEFESQDVSVLELLFHVVKGVDAEKLFMEEKQLTKANTKELQSLMQKEKALLSGHARHGPSRHNRFGTMVWLKRGDERVSTVSGQEFLGDDQRGLIHMDKTKKWNKPRFRGRKSDQTPEEEFDIAVPVTDRARKYLRSFIADFIDSAFNPFFEHLRKMIDREAKRVLEEHHMQYVYILGWFLKAESARRKAQTKGTRPEAVSKDTDAHNESFSLISTALTPESFVLLNRFMQTKADDKAWNDLNAGMKCFTQILLTIQDMAESPYVFDIDVAENLQNRVFYEETTHDRIIQILRGYKDQGFGYLDACTELSHVFLRLIEQYSKQNVDLQIRSRRRARRKKKAEEGNTEGDTHAEHQDDVEQSYKIVKERSFDFKRFSAKFTTQACVDTYLALTKYYNDLSAEQLKRAHRFFYRVAFKMEQTMMLYRIDILQLFYKMIQGPLGLGLESPHFKEWNELIKQIFRRALKKLEERPELYVELLFSKMPSTMYYLEHGFDREVIKSAPRAPAELEVKPGMEKKEQIGVAVGILIDQMKSDALAWIKQVLSTAIEERKAWEDSMVSQADAEVADTTMPDKSAPSVELQKEADAGKASAPSILIKPDNDERKQALFKDNKLRLLLELLDFVRIGDREDPEASWVIPSSATSAHLSWLRDTLAAFEFAPPTYEDGKSALDHVRSKAVARRRAALSDEEDSEGSSSSGEETFQPAGGPDARAPDHVSTKTKKRRLKRKRQELDDEERQKRRNAREEAERSKMKKIKSSLFIDSEDDLTDEERDREFFAREAAQRERSQADVLKELTTSRVNSLGSRKRKGAPDISSKRGKKGKNHNNPFSDSEDGESSNAGSATRGISVLQSSPSRLDSAGEEEEVEETPDSSPQPIAQRRSTGSEEEVLAKVVDRGHSKGNVAVDDDDSDDDEPVVSQAQPRRLVRAGFVIDSDSD